MRLSLFCSRMSFIMTFVLLLIRLNFHRSKSLKKDTCSPNVSYDWLSNVLTGCSNRLLLMSDVLGVSVSCVSVSGVLGVLDVLDIFT